MIDAFIAIGFATTVVIGIVLLVFVVNSISVAIHEAAWVYKYRHRFDNPPKARCYCIDCKFHGDRADRTRCTNHKMHTADAWFCKDAEPKTKGDDAS